MNSRQQDNPQHHRKPHPTAAGGERVLLVGNGGREHALAWAISRSRQLDHLYVTPASERSFTSLLKNTSATDIDPNDHAAITKFCNEQSITLAIIGPETPLVNGLADELRAIGVDTFGPSGLGAQLEGSKGYTKRLCSEAGIPTARYALCSRAEQAAEFIENSEHRVVVKADGLAGGKGVIIAEDKSQAMAAVKDIFQGKFGKAGSQVVVEEFLQGIEVSCFALTDGNTLQMLPTAQDYKQAYDGDSGDNTGGMGAVAPVELLSDEGLAQVRKTIFEPTLAWLKQRGIVYQGVLYAGLMVNPSGIYLLEYNVRFGDPECQVLLPLMTGDWLEVFAAVARGTLDRQRLTWSKHHAVSVVMASADYPRSSSPPSLITGALAAQEQSHTGIIFWAGAQRDNSAADTLLATGGRVLNVTATAASIAGARAAAYEMVAGIHWKQGRYRRDIGWRATAKPDSDSSA